MSDPTPSSSPDRLSVAQTRRVIRGSILVVLKTLDGPRSIEDIHAIANIVETLASAHEALLPAYPASGDPSLPSLDE